jgi:hypothetical protein
MLYTSTNPGFLSISFDIIPFMLRPLVFLDIRPQLCMAFNCSACYMPQQFLSSSILSILIEFGGKHKACADHSDRAV